MKTALENDANCAALAEFGLGNGLGVQNLAVMTLGTGVGGGIILNGKLHNGNRNMAGEFGFMFIHGIHTKRQKMKSSQVMLQPGRFAKMSASERDMQRMALKYSGCLKKTIHRPKSLWIISLIH